jgi:hypothetical protein
MDRLILEGEAYWAFITEPSVRFEPCYSINLVMDTNSLKLFEEKGHNIRCLKGVQSNTVKEHKRKTKNGTYITIKEHERRTDKKSLVIKRRVRQEKGMIINPPIFLCSDINKAPLKNGTKVKVACKEWQHTGNYGTFTGLDLEAVQVV